MQYLFLEGGGEMGQLTRTHDWATTSLGTPDTWPQSLKTTISIILNSRFPMSLFWGPQHICFYNDAYRPCLGNDGKHPYALGRPVAEVWPEMWQHISLQITQVLNGGHATWHEDQLLPVYRNQKPEDIYWTYSYSPVRDEDGHIAGVFTTCTETTDKILQLEAIAESKDELEFAIESTELGVWELNPFTNKFKANPRLRSWFGVSPDQEIQLRPVLETIAEQDRNNVIETINDVMQFQSGGYYDIDFTIIHPDTRQARMVKAKGRAWFNEDKIAYRFNGTLQDITQQKTIAAAVQHNEALYRNLVLSNPIGTVLFKGRDMVVEIINKSMLKQWHKDTDVVGKTLSEAIPELHDQPFLSNLQSVYDTGTGFENKESLAYVMVDGQLQPLWFSTCCNPLYDSEGNIYGVIHTAVNITDLMLARQKLQDSERRFRSFIENTPVATAVFAGKELIVDVANDVMIAYWGKDPNVIGTPFRKAVPELEGQGFFEQLEAIFITGRELNSSEARADIIKDGVFTTAYFNYSFTPLFDDTGKVYAILNMAVDVTPQVLARQKVDEAEAHLRAVIELAELATWSMDIQNGVFRYSARFMDWLGFSEDTKTTDEAYNPLPDEYRISVPAALQAAITEGSSGVYDNIHPIVNRLTGQVRIIHAQGLVIYDADSNPIEIRGTAQDITIHREVQLTLEAQVQQRTEQLATAIEELQSTNEELENTNQSLSHSNNELAQYAYVASHDLQEPLRKILIYSGLLHDKNVLDEKNQPLLDKIRSSAKRMSQLISNLLDFSRLLKHEKNVKQVNLSEVMYAVANDFELNIQETSATLEIWELPQIQAIGLHINQLFYNLLGNALKFISEDRKPHVCVSAVPIRTEQVKKYIPRPLPSANYYDITFEDNGIGFEAQHSEQIFEVFKRLHGREIYPGSGIGLALCHRIVANLQGHIYAVSEIGKGSTFHIILPDTQAQVSTTTDA